MNILVDLAGTDLSYAMHLLFERRLGHKLYFIKGLEWYNKGYFKYVDEPAIVGQFLEATPTGYYKKHDWSYETLTYDEFLKIKDSFDLCLALIGTNEVAFGKLISEQIPHAKLIRQIGNPFETISENSARNILMSITPSDQYLNNFSTNVLMAERNFVFAHQEFDTKTEFVYKPPTRLDRVSSYQGNIYDPVTGIQTGDYHDLWKKMSELLPEFDFHLYGTWNTHGSFVIGRELGESMSEAAFIWQTKNGEDGGGHLTHNAFAVGRPLIVRKNQFGGLMLEMLQDGETCIDLTHPGRSLEKSAELIRECAKPENHIKMCEKVYETFKKYCDYDKEEQDIRSFMEKLQ